MSVCPCALSLPSVSYQCVVLCAPRSGAYMCVRVRMCLCQITLPVLCCPALRPSFLIAFRGMSEVGVGVGIVGHGYSSAPRYIKAGYYLPLTDTICVCLAI